MWLLRWTLLNLLVLCVLAWSQDEMEIYDLVEEIGQETSFYSVLNVSQEASSSEIRRAFRQISLQLHPDKNKEEGSDVRFRKIVGVHEVLRSESRRAIYDKFLVDGLPDWRSAMFYYRRVRKMGLLEVASLLVVIITVGQYLTGWASYHDKKMTLEQQLRPKCKREKMPTIQFEKLVEENMREFRPSWSATLPFQLCWGVIWLLTVAPFQLTAFVRAEMLRRRNHVAETRRQVEQQQQAAAEQHRLRQRRQQARDRRRQRVQQNETLQVITDTSHEAGGGRIEEHAVPVADSFSWSTAKSGVWTDDDLVELSRLVNKMPTAGGDASDRWEKIARALERSLAEVTAMARRIKQRPQLVPLSSAAQSTAITAPLLPTKIKTRVVESDSSSPAISAWSQKQQRALEAALVQFPKGCAERWDRVAKAVPDKNKEECMQRFRHLAESLRKRKTIECTPQSIDQDSQCSCRQEEISHENQKQES